MIKRIPALLIGDLQAGTAVNDHDVTFIQMGAIEGEDYVSIDEIEARALCMWLATSLGFTLTQGANDGV